METKLKERYTQDQILEFYSSFESSMKVYELEDKETVDHLFEMIDFDKFKARMCNQKAYFLKEKENVQELSKMTND